MTDTATAQPDPKPDTEPQETPAEESTPRTEPDTTGQHVDEVTPDQVTEPVSTDKPATGAETPSTTVSEDH
jgi:hypothetical protein